MSFVSKLTRNLSFWVIIFGIFGYVAAMAFGDPSWTKASGGNEFYEFILLLKSLFLDMLKMLVGPMIFFSLLGGMLNIGDKATLREMGLSAIIYYVVTTGIAICIGLAAVTFIHPWTKAPAPVKNTSQVTGTSYKKPSKFIEEGSDSVVMIFKNTLKRALQNPVKAIAENNVLGIATAAFLLGLAMIFYLPGGGSLAPVIREANLLINHVLHWVIKTTPLGVFAIAFDFQLKMGGSVIADLLSFGLLVVGATLFHGLVVLPAIAYFVVGVKPTNLIRKMSKPLLVALSTSSSSATLPVTMQTCEEEFGVQKGVAGFVFPLGATMNMDGTALFEGIAAIFLADIFGVHLGPVQIVLVFFMSMISSIGAPGMPSGSMAGMQIVLLAVGIPLEAIGVLLVIERPLDTIRTAVNVEGDMIGALVVQKKQIQEG